jgi:hypothetical protein
MKTTRRFLLLAFAAVLISSTVGATTASAQRGRGGYRGPAQGRAYGGYRPRTFNYGYRAPYIAPRRNLYYRGIYGGGSYGSNYGYPYAYGYPYGYGSSFYYYGPNFGFSTYYGNCR